MSLGALLKKLRPVKSTSRSSQSAFLQEVGQADADQRFAQLQAAQPTADLAKVRPVATAKGGRDSGRDLCPIVLTWLIVHNDNVDGGLAPSTGTWGHTATEFGDC